MSDLRTTDPEFYEYLMEMESRKQYTKLTPEEEEQYDKMCVPPENGFTMDHAKKHPFLFAYYVIGIKPRKYQWKMLNDMYIHQKLGVVTSRQIGKSVSASIFSFWSAYTNAFPSGPYKDTKVMVVSHTEDAAKDMLRAIDDFMHMADARWATYTRDSKYHKKTYFHDHVKKQTVDEIVFPSGSIRAYPPTQKVRGKTIDVLIIDEAAWLNCPDPDAFFEGAAEPTTTNTKGKIILFSTPKSTNGFYYNIIQPDEEVASEGWYRIMFPWTVVEVESVRQEIWNKRKQYIKRGAENSFKIEYECDFRSGKYSYFNPDDIDGCVVPGYINQPSWNQPVIMGLDFGDTHSRTVLTIVTHDPKTNKVRLLWYKEFPSGYNNADLPAFIDNLVKSGRFLPKTIVCDDCVGGKTAIELLRRRGYNLTMFGFKALKEEYYEYMKNAFANKQIELYPEPTVTAQLKGLEAHELPSGKTAIRKPNGGRDDICDSLMMACSPFIKPRKKNNWRFSNFK